MANKTAKATVKKKTVKKPSAVKNTKKTNDTMLTSIKKILKSKSVGFKGTPSVSVLVSEFIGTFLLVAAIFSVQGYPLYITFAIIGIILLISGMSKAHINPIITIGAWATKKIRSASAIGHIAAQALGAAASYLVLNAYLAGTTTSLTSKAPALFHAGTFTTGKEWFLLFAELLGAFILAFGISKVVKANKVIYAVGYGFIAFIALTIAGTLSSLFLTESYQVATLTFINPAVAFAGNAITWNIWPIAIYILAPVIGGIAGFALNDLLEKDK